MARTGGGGGGARRRGCPRGNGSDSDYATGRPINPSHPEEHVRQEYERTLHEDYGYGCGLMDIEVPIAMGGSESGRGAPRADIVVYETADPLRRDQFKDIAGIVETKRRERRDGVRQLKSYMAAAKCLWGVWTNGDEIEYVYKDPDTGDIKSDFIHQIPRHGESLRDIGRLSKARLVPIRNLKPVFRRLLNTLYTNTNISRREKLGNELIRLIFCKIWDEKYYPNQVPEFRVSPGEDPGRVMDRVRGLFDSVKNDLDGEGVFDPNESITLEDRSAVHVVGELQQYALLRTDKDVIGDAFEVFAESKLVGEKGEFFTPREVVRTAVALVDPRPGQTVCDPACGSGGFLIYAMDHVWGRMDRSRKYRGVRDMARLKRDMAERCFFGIDKEIDLVKIAKAYMIIVGDGRGRIAQQNTLHRPEDYEDPARAIFIEGGALREFDIVMTNPPFGSKIKVLKEDAGDFELGTREGPNGSRTPKDTEPQELFVERCLQMLRDGGTLAIVLPETYFHAPSKRHVLEFMRRNNNIRAVVDLPHDTFRPHNNAKTILVVLSKGRPQQDEITMAVIEGIGHDAQGRPLYRYDRARSAPTDEVWDDSPIVRREIARPSAPENRHVFTVRSADIRNGVHVPRYYWRTGGRALEREADKRGCDLVPMSSLIDRGIVEAHDGHGSPRAQHKGKGPIPYVRVADIVNWDAYKNYTATIPESEYSRVKAGGVDLRPNDVLFVRRGSYRIGTVALLTGDLRILLTREIKVFRVVDAENEYGLVPEYLVYLLSHDMVQRQLKNLIFMDTTLPNLGDRWMDLRLPLFRSRRDRDRVTDAMVSIFDGKRALDRAIADVDRRHGPLTT